MYVFCDPSGHQPLPYRKTRGRLSSCSTTTPLTQSQEAQNPEIELHMYVSDSSVSFCNIANCVGNVTNMRSVFHSRHIFNNAIHTRMTQEGAGQGLQIEHGVYVTE